MSAMPLDCDRYAGLPEVAERLGVHRATVNDMVRSNRLPAIRLGARWLVDRDDLIRFAETYTRPLNAPDRKPPVTIPPTTPQILALLEEFESASAAELAPLLHLHEGNVRKHLRLLEAVGVVARRPDGEWEISEA
jgi:excisionase family DNA binding protein